MISLPLSAHAYLDPGTGSMILQGIIASIAIGMATAKLWWYRLTSIFSRSDKKQAEEKEIIDPQEDNTNS